MFRAVKPLSLTFLAVQALLNEPPDLLRGKAVLKGEKSPYSGRPVCLQFTLLAPASGADMKKIGRWSFCDENGGFCVTGCPEEIPRVASTVSSMTWGSRECCPRTLPGCCVRLGGSPFMSVGSSPVSHGRAISGRSSLSSVSSVVTPFVYARLC